jgi:hypothetical protein
MLGVVWRYTSVFTVFVSFILYFTILRNIFQVWYKIILSCFSLCYYFYFIICNIFLRTVNTGFENRSDQSVFNKGWCRIYKLVLSPFLCTRGLWIIIQTSLSQLDKYNNFRDKSFISFNWKRCLSLSIL